MRDKEIYLYQRQKVKDLINELRETKNIGDDIGEYVFIEKSQSKFIDNWTEFLEALLNYLERTDERKIATI